ncbi:hypothetical protein RFI_31211 [Reticulomyxa filosa]|uniref:Uncharacterized protein n=1 Tax=Reticulomyxa filosa TaxID=46433 RepID=X6LX28_RETFI|nr:hypothetical protein RFI_31211 [Reticulomyxa filosa]|eukprot:ETO06184.1 hypothetical protein RFI_31211 [Reticulomyxa filosa]
MTRLPWYKKILLRLEYPAFNDNPFDRKLAEFCRYCRHFVGSHKGNIKDYFELLQEYQTLDESDKELMTKLLSRRSICPVCFRPFGSNDKYYRWQVILEVLSFYVFMCFIWIPLIILLFFPALFDRFWSNIETLQKPESKTTDTLINADIDLEYIDFEYKATVRGVMMKNNDTSTDLSVAIDDAVLEDEMESED